MGVTGRVEIFVGLHGIQFVSQRNIVGLGIKNLESLIFPSFSNGSEDV